MIVLVIIAPASATGARAQQKVTPPKKTIQGGTAVALQDGGVAASAYRRVPQIRKCRRELSNANNWPQVVDSKRDSTISDKSDKPRGEGESKSEEEDSKKRESNDLSEDSEPSEHACLNKVEEEGVASKIRQLTL